MSKNPCAKAHVSGPGKDLGVVHRTEGRSWHATKKTKSSTRPLPVAPLPRLHPTQAPDVICPWLAMCGHGVQAWLSCGVGLGVRDEIHASLASTRMMIERLLAEAKAAGTQRTPKCLPDPR